MCISVHVIHVYAYLHTCVPAYPCTCISAFLHRILDISCVPVAALCRCKFVGNAARDERQGQSMAGAIYTATNDRSLTPLPTTIERCYFIGNQVSLWLRRSSVTVLMPLLEQCHCTKATN